MRLTQKLLGFLNRVFNKDPDPFLALRLRHTSGHMTWRVKDAVLTTLVPGETGLLVNLLDYTISELVDHLAAQPGYVVEYADTSDLALLSARALIDAAGDIEMSNGDHLMGYRSPLWAYLEAAASELTAAAEQIKQMLRQMSTKTASGEWLDEIGGYYGVPRLSNEADSAYGPRIITETLRPRGNNVAIANAIKEFTGQTATVTDVVLYSGGLPIYDGSIDHDGTFTHSAGSSPVYGLFDVEYGYNLINGGSLDDFAIEVRNLIDRLRDAGTHLRDLHLIGGALFDEFTPPGDEMLMTLSQALTDTLDPPTESVLIGLSVPAMTDTLIEQPVDSASIVLTYGTLYNGVINYNGARIHQGGANAPEALIG
jgi:hypothetical protein